MKPKHPYEVADVAETIEEALEAFTKANTFDASGGILTQEMIEQATQQMVHNSSKPSKPLDFSHFEELLAMIGAPPQPGKKGKYTRERWRQVTSKYKLQNHNPKKITEAARHLLSEAVKQGPNAGMLTYQIDGVKISRAALEVLADGPEPQMNPKYTYVLCPGHVIHRGDSNSNYQGDFISAHQLANLYGVPIDKCLVYDPRDPYKSMGFHDKDNYLYLMPRADGVYMLPDTEDV